MQKAKVIMVGSAQAICLPDEFRVQGPEVYLKKIPDGFLVMERDPWELFLEGVEELSQDFMADGRDQGLPQERDLRL